MSTKEEKTYQSANLWIYLGTLGCFASSFPYTSEWTAQCSEIIATSLGYAPEKSPSIFGFKKIGGVSAVSYTIGCSIALIATLGLCYAVFYQLLSYQNDGKKKLCKMNKVRKVLNLIAILGSLIVVNVWISGTALTIFLLPIRLSLTQKIQIIVTLFLLGIIPSITYAGGYAGKLPEGSSNSKETTPHSNACATKNDVVSITEKIEKSYFLQYTTKIIFFCTGFFCNTYFLAYLVQSHIFYRYHLPQFYNISILAWSVGIIIGLFFTLSAIYIYPITLKKYSDEDACSKIYPSQYLALAGFCGVSILDTFFPISISLMYLSRNTKKNIALIFIYIAAACLSVLCTIAPYQTAKTAIEKYNAINSTP